MLRFAGPPPEWISELTRARRSSWGTSSDYREGGRCRTGAKLNNVYNTLFALSQFEGEESSAQQLTEGVLVGNSSLVFYAETHLPLNVSLWGTFSNAHTDRMTKEPFAWLGAVTQLGCANRYHVLPYPTLLSNPPHVGVCAKGCKLLIEGGPDFLKTYVSEIDRRRLTWNMN